MVASPELVAAGLRLIDRLARVLNDLRLLNDLWLLLHHRNLLLNDRRRTVDRRGRVGRLSVIVTVIRSPAARRSGCDQASREDGGPFHVVFPFEAAGVGVQEIERENARQHTSGRERY